jgi:hypothetical protein
LNLYRCIFTSDNQKTPESSSSSRAYYVPVKGLAGTTSFSNIYSEIYRLGWSSPCRFPFPLGKKGEEKRWKKIPAERRRGEDENEFYANATILRNRYIWLLL